jgi:methyl-accepting chemotaxis protein
MAESHQQIFDDAQKRISDLHLADVKINVEINTIKDHEFDRPLTPSERARIVELRTSKASIAAAVEELSFVTMAALDTTDELKRINNAIAGVVKDLRSTVKRIEKIGQVADTIAKILGGVQELSKKINKLTNEGQ